mmetsp:Transcript_24103/g.29253  ORF Transcript_24103/g.29253 Transcript_24103/m.29253 type:complete len:82 (+) Transcript_24103:357-602(+)
MSMSSHKSLYHRKKLHISLKEVYHHANCHLAAKNFTFSPKQANYNLYQIVASSITSIEQQLLSYPASSTKLQLFSHTRMKT